MMDFIVQNKEVLALCTSVLGILLALAFGGILGWRQKICLDYESRRDVAINILRDRFIQRTSEHYSDVADERKRQRTAVEDIYRRPEQQELIRALAGDLEDQNRVRRLFRWLSRASETAFGFIWSAVIVTILGIGAVWVRPGFAMVVIWLALTGIMLLGFFVSVTMMWVLDARFFRLVHRIIEPEGE